VVRGVATERGADVSDRVANIATSDDKRLIVGAFHGGTARGQCIQLTVEGPINNDYVQLTRPQVGVLYRALRDWLAGT
jgi:hypothetical protein